MMINQNRLREQLLHRPGFQKPVQQCGDEEIQQHATLLSTNKLIRRPLYDISKNYRCELSTLSNIKRKNSTRKSSIRKRSVRFDNEVMVKLIASHKRYSKSIRNELWNNSEHIQENAYRNKIEYQAEGIEWKLVLEEDDMYVDPQTGEHIHPHWA